PAELAGRVGRVGAAGAALHGAGGNALAVLGRRVGPRATADAREEVADIRLGRAAARPLRAPPDDVDRRRLLDRTAVIEEVAALVRMVGRVSALHLQICRARLVGRRGSTHADQQHEHGEQRQTDLDRSTHEPFLPKPRLWTADGPAAGSSYIQEAVKRQPRKGPPHLGSNCPPHSWGGVGGADGGARPITVLRALVLP